MENVTFEVKGSKLIITCDAEHRGGVSKSGKTIRVASTEGNVTVPGTEKFEGGPIKAGINLYVKV